MAQLFSLEHGFENLEREMKKQIFTENDFVSAMKYASKPLQEELRVKTPSSNGKYRAARRTRAKYGILRRVKIAAYIAPHRRDRARGLHGVNVGYFTRNGKKAFVASFLNYGYRSIYRGGQFYKTPYAGWVNRAEKKTLPEMVNRFKESMQKKFDKKVKKMDISSKLIEKYL